MPNITLSALGRALGVALALRGGAAVADPPHAMAERGETHMAFRDWSLRCFGAACAIGAEVLGADGSEVLVVEIAGGDAALTLRTGLPLFLPDGATVALGDEPLRPIPWRTCDVAGCEARTPLGADLIAALRRERSAVVTLTLEDGVRVRLPLSLLGFTAAWRALGAAVPVSPP